MTAKDNEISTRAGRSRTRDPKRFSSILDWRFLVPVVAGAEALAHPGILTTAIAMVCFVAYAFYRDILASLGKAAKLEGSSAERWMTRFSRFMEPMAVVAITIAFIAPGPVTIAAALATPIMAYAQYKMVQSGAIVQY